MEHTSHQSTHLAEGQDNSLVEGGWLVDCLLQCSIEMVVQPLVLCDVINDPREQNCVVEALRHLLVQVGSEKASCNIVSRQ